MIEIKRFSPKEFLGVKNPTVFELLRKNAIGDRVSVDQCSSKEREKTIGPRQGSLGPLDFF